MGPRSPEYQTFYAEKLNFVPTTMPATDLETACKSESTTSDCLLIDI